MSLIDVGCVAARLHGYRRSFIEFGGEQGGGRTMGLLDFVGDVRRARFERQITRDAMVTLAQRTIERDKIEHEWREVQPFPGMSDATVDRIMRSITRGIDVARVLERSEGYDESYDDSVLLAVMATIKEFRETSSLAPSVPAAECPPCQPSVRQIE